ncbi:tyrosine-type recombinase/integrase [Halomonas sp. DP8Y7-3]|uniref:site-specific integrase n=1 Tax=Halomonas sp. DP8Y7-3 TaxID=2859079 RepID=UPI001C98DD1D|nr:site-specific integrase [Halomonas sp. DP8Y7-3]MBY5930477.1 tyrosine-type recombinase/integrase [Halomonas sp. DP8Y7-3]
MAYLMKDRNGTFYLRIVLSKAQKASYGRREYRRSLSTKSQREANRRLPEAYMKAIHELSCGVMPSTHQKTPPFVPGRPLLAGIFKDYKAQLKLSGYTGRTIDGKDSALEFLYKVIGNKAVDAYTRQDVKQLQDTLLKMPPNFQKRLTTGLSVQQVINLNRNGKTLSTITFNNYMAMYIAVFNYAIKEGYIENNPFRKTRIHQKKLKSSYRDVFSTSDLHKIFSYVEGKLDIGDRNFSDPSKKVLRADRYWLTYLCYYTAGRLNELAQLYTNDIYQVNGIWCIHIRAGNKYQRIKNLNSERVIPIHRSLISLGFLQYVQQQDGHIFPMLTYLEKNGYGHHVSAWFTKTIRKLNISNGRKLSMHSFRHTGANLLKQQGIEAHLISGLLGHSTGTISLDRYGKTLNPESLIEVVNKITPVDNL